MGPTWGTFFGPKQYSKNAFGRLKRGSSWTPKSGPLHSLQHVIPGATLGVRISTAKMHFWCDLGATFQTQKEEQILAPKVGPQYCKHIARDHFGRHFLGPNWNHAGNFFPFQFCPVVEQKVNRKMAPAAWWCRDLLLRPTWRTCLGLSCSTRKLNQKVNKNPEHNQTPNRVLPHSWFILCVPGIS